MKLKHIFATAIGAVMALGSIGLSFASKNAPIQESASAAVGNALFNLNTGNVSAKTITKSDNPDVWGYDNVTGRYSDFTNTATTNVTTGSSVTGATIGDWTVSGRAGATLTVSETAATKKCTGLYLPIAVYLPSVPAYTKRTYTVTFTVTIKGGSSSNYVSARLETLGSGATNSKTEPSYEYVPFPKTDSDLWPSGGTRFASIGTNSADTAVSETRETTLSINNTSDVAGHKIALYAGLFLTGRKDSSKSHQIVATVKASLDTLDSETTYIAKRSDGTLYENFYTCLNNAAENDTITLLNNLSIYAVQTVNKNLYLNLNGYYIEQATANTAAFNIDSGVYFEISGSGSVTNTSASGATIINYGRLIIGSDVIINNKSTNTNSKGLIMQGGSTSINGTITAGGNAIYISKGTAYLYGSANIISTRGIPIRMIGGEICLMNNVTITHYDANPDFYITVTSGGVDGTIYADNLANANYYTGAELKIQLSGNPSENVSVVKHVNAPKFSVTNTPETGMEYAFDYNTLTVKYRKIKRSIDFTCTKCTFTGSTTYTYGTDYTATITPTTGYHIDTVTVTCNGATLVDGEDYEIIGKKFYLYETTLKYAVSVTIVCTADAYTVTYMANSNDATGSVVDTNTYAYGENAKIKTNGFTWAYHTFAGWSQNKDATTGDISPNANIVMQKDLVLYAIWTQTTANRVDEFADVYMKMSSYDTNKDNSEGEGLCMDYYAAAKEAFNALPDEAKEYICTTNSYSMSYLRARLSAWAEANGDVFDVESYTLSAQKVNSNKETTNIALLILISCAAVGGVAALFLLKKKKYN